MTNTQPRRVLKTCKMDVQPCVPTLFSTPKDLTDWLTEQANKYGCTHLLAHAEDGVVWGKFAQADSAMKLATSYEAEQVASSQRPNSAALNPTTLWQARLFGETAEVLLWREVGVSGAAWQARVICDEAGEGAQYFDEQQLLLGSEGDVLSKTGFTRLREGAEEMIHVVPLDASSATRNKRVRLTVRSYLAAGELVARVAMTRLVGLVGIEIKEVK